jgi:hypothetical protein
MQCPLTTAARTAVGQTRRSSCLGMSASPPTPDVSLQGNEPTLRAISGRQPLYSITSSALAMIVCGNVSPIDLAVLRLMTSSNFVGS